MDVASLRVTQEELVRNEESGYRGRLTQSGPITGLGNLIEEAKSRGISVAMVSNAPKEDARSSLEGLGLRDAFEPMVFAEDVGAEKPDPAPYREALKKLGIYPEEALAFEDSPSGMGGAVAAGIPSWASPRPTALTSCGKPARSSSWGISQTGPSTRD